MQIPSVNRGSPNFTPQPPLKKPPPFKSEAPAERPIDTIRPIPVRQSTCRERCYRCFTYPFKTVHRLLQSFGHSLIRSIKNFFNWCSSKCCCKRSLKKEENLPISKPKEMSPSFHARDIKDCSICADSLSLPVELPCGHVFDLHCLVSLVKLECPHCRAPISNLKSHTPRPDLMKNLKDEEALSLEVKFYSRETKILCSTSIQAYLSTPVEAIKKIVCRFVQNSSDLFSSLNVSYHYVLYNEKQEVIQDMQFSAQQKEELTLKDHAFQSRKTYTLFLKEKEKASCDTCYTKEPKEDCTHLSLNEISRE